MNGSLLLDELYNLKACLPFIELIATDKNKSERLPGILPRLLSKQLL